MNKTEGIIGGTMLMLALAAMVVTLSSVHRRAHMATSPITTRHLHRRAHKTVAPQGPTHAVRSPKPSSSSHSSTLVQPGTAPGTALTSYEAVSGLSASASTTTSVELTAVPWAPGETWALVPLAVQTRHNMAATLWFGEQTTPGGRWTWIPSTLPGALNPALPRPVYQALAWAYDLYDGQSGPTLYGTVSWQALTGHVGLPQGWTLARQQTGPEVQDTTLSLTVYQPSYAGTFRGDYGMVSNWTGHNAATGTHALNQIIASSDTLTQLIAAANPSPAP